MDIALLTAFLSPLLPFLTNLGQKATVKATESASSKFGEAAWSKAQAVWKRLSPQMEAKEASKEAVLDVASNPEDEDYQASLRVQLKKLFEHDPELSAEISRIMQEDAPDGTSGAQIIQNVTGNQNQTIGQVFGGKVVGNVEGSVTV